MSNELFLITGATGATGGYAIAELLAKSARVRAMVHSQDERAEKLRAKGVEVIVGDLLDPRAIRRAVDGITGAYFVYPIHQGKLADGTAYFAEAAKEAKLRAIVNMSQISARPDAVSYAALSHWYSERIFDWAGIPVTHLRPTFFMEWLMYGFQLPLIAQHDLLKVPAGEGRHAPIAAEDQGRVIASILLNPDDHIGKIYNLYGAAEMNHSELASAVGEALGRKITYENERFDAFESRLTEVGMTPYFIQHIVNVYRDYNAGVFAGTNDVVRELTGRAPVTVKEYVKANLESFQPS